MLAAPATPEAPPFPPANAAELAGATVPVPPSVAEQLPTEPADAPAMYEYTRQDGTVERATSFGAALEVCPFLGKLAAQDPAAARALLEVTAIGHAKLAQQAAAANAARSAGQSAGPQAKQSPGAPATVGGLFGNGNKARHVEPEEPAAVNQSVEPPVPLLQEPIVQHPALSPDAHTPPSAVVLAPMPLAQEPEALPVSAETTLPLPVYEQTRVPEEPTPPAAPQPAVVPPSAKTTHEVIPPFAEPAPFAAVEQPQTLDVPAVVSAPPPKTPAPIVPPPMLIPLQEVAPHPALVALEPEAATAAPALTDLLQRVGFEPPEALPQVEYESQPPIISVDGALADAHLPVSPLVSGYARPFTLARDLLPTIEVVADNTPPLALTEVIDPLPNTTPTIATAVAEQLDQLALADQVDDTRVAVEPVLGQISGALVEIETLVAGQAEPQAIKEVEAQLELLVTTLFTRLDVKYQAQDVRRFVHALLHTDFPLLQRLQQRPDAPVDLEHDGTHEAKRHFPPFFSGQDDQQEGYESRLRRLLGSAMLVDRALS